MAINFPEKTKRDLAKKFDVESETGSMFSHEYDQEFAGVNTVNVHVVTTVPLQDYNRSKEVGTGSRYGTTTEVGDTVLTYTLTQDRSMSLSIDKGNAQEQFNMKSAQNVMKAEKEEHIIPEIDKYRFGKWADGAGIHVKVAAPTKANIVGSIFDLRTQQKNAHVKNNVELAIKTSVAKYLTLSEEFSRLNEATAKALGEGYIGKIAGMYVKEITDDNMPANVPFMLIHKRSVISPVTIQTLRVHKDPPGLNGDLIEYRMRYDAFVLGHIADGVAVAVTGDNVVADPTISMSGKTATLASATTDATIKYTLDGSDPRTSKSAKTGKTATVGATDTLRVAAVKDGLYWSNVVKG